MKADARSIIAEDPLAADCKMSALSGQSLVDTTVNVNSTLMSHAARSDRLIDIDIDIAADNQSTANIVNLLDPLSATNTTVHPADVAQHPLEDVFKGSNDSLKKAAG